MRPAYALALAVLLAGCGRAGTLQQQAADACSEQSYKDPTVQRILMIGAGQPAYLADHQLEMDAARHEAEQKCLVARGIAPRGGVQPRTPQWYDPIF